MSIKVYETFRGSITWRIFRGLHISNPTLLNMFGFVMGGGIATAKTPEVPWHSGGLVKAYFIRRSQ